MLPILLYAASQAPPAPVDVGQPLWPYIAAIGALSTVVTFLFGLLMKEHRERASEVKEINKSFLDATEEKSRRVAEEFAKKDATILQIATDFARLMEKSANELAAINERERNR